jgi:hypothetical protein
MAVSNETPVVRANRLAIYAPLRAAFPQAEKQATKNPPPALGGDGSGVVKNR